MLRSLYRILSAFAFLSAASKGPGGMVRFGVRRVAHRGLARSMRRLGL